MYKENKNYTSISIAISPELIKLLDEGDYNKSKLIDKLLTNYFNSQSADKNNINKK
jgi:hypothetical protein